MKQKSSSTETKGRSTLVRFVLLIMLSIGSFLMWSNNDYSTYRDVPVTFIDKFTQPSCTKHHSCYDRFYGLFRTDDGIVFDRPISAYMFRQMRLNEQFTLNLRPFDIRQTPMDNVIWVFGAIIIHTLTFILWCMFICSACYEWYQKRNPKEDIYSAVTSRKG